MLKFFKKIILLLSDSEDTISTTQVIQSNQPILPTQSENLSIVNNKLNYQPNCQPNQKISDIKTMCEKYTNEKYLTYVDIAKLMIEIYNLHKFMLMHNLDTKNLNFLSLVINTSQVPNARPIFINPSHDFSQLKDIAHQLLTNKMSNYAICYWDGVRYKDGISFQIFGSHNTTSHKAMSNYRINLINPSTCYDEIIKEIRQEINAEVYIKKIIIYCPI